MRAGAPRIGIPLALVGSACVAGFGNVVVAVGRATGQPEWTTLVGNILLAVFALAFLCRRGWSPSALGLAWRLPRREPAAWVVGAAVVWAVAWLAAGIIGPRDINVLRVVRLVGGTAVAEEALHRGVIVALWAASGVTAPLVVMANMVTFSAWHIVGAIDCGHLKVGDIAWPAVGALVFLSLRLRTGTFLAAAAGHLAANITGLSAITARLKSACI